MIKKRGMVLMITLTTITLLVVILQQVAFDSKIEFENGVTHYHSLKAYHASKSGIELALFKVLIYKKIINYLKNRSEDRNLAPFIQQYEQYTHWIWNQPLVWPPVISPDASETLKSELQDKMSESLFQTSYETKVEAEVAKLNLMDMVSPSSEKVRQWAKDVFYSLMINIREKSRWFQDNYSINEIRKLIDEVEKMLNPSIWNTTTQTYSIYQLNDLKHIENIHPEWIEWVRPYVTLYSAGGLNIQWSDPLILQSLHESITYEKAKKMVDQKIEDNMYLSNFNKVKSFFAQNDLESAITSYEDEEILLKDLVLHFDPPQIFKITSIGTSGNISHKTEVILYDSQHIFNKTYEIMDYLKEKTKYERPTREEHPIRFRNNAIQRDRPLPLQTSPFIIHWKDIN